jgi:tryptophan synthase alpha chain
VADGPTIQKAITRSLDNGTRPAHVLGMVRRLRSDGVTTPILAMTYANLFYAPGWDVSAARLRRAGVDGTIVPDVPLEESAAYRRAWKKQGLASVLLATPVTPDDRLARIARATSGFLYLVAVHGTTGARAEVADETKRLLRRVARLGHRTPACVGFGVSRPSHVRTLKREGADGVVVGSAIVDRIAARRSVRAYLSGLRRAT